MFWPAEGLSHQTYTALNITETHSHTSVFLPVKELGWEH